MNTNFWCGFNAFAFPQFSFMPIPWSFSNFTPIFDVNKYWNNWNNWNFNNFSSNIWDTNNKISYSTYTPAVNIDSFVKTSAAAATAATTATADTADTADTTATTSSTNNALKDYNSFAGHRLAEIAMQGRQFNRWDSVPAGKGKCAFFVSNALEKAGMSNGLRGDAYQMINILKNNPNFKQIPADSIDVDELPAGTILAYERGSQGYSEDFGHIEIMTEDGRGVSQAITNNVRDPDAIFIPV